MSVTGFRVLFLSTAVGAVGPACRPSQPGPPSARPLLACRPRGPPNARCRPARGGPPQPRRCRPPRGARVRPPLSLLETTSVTVFAPGRTARRRRRGTRVGLGVECSPAGVLFVQFKGSNPEAHQTGAGYAPPLTRDPGPGTRDPGTRRIEGGRWPVQGVTGRVPCVPLGARTCVEVPAAV